MKKLSVISALFVLIFLPVGASAENLVFATSVWPPYVISENGKASGIDTEIVLEICRRLKIDPEIQVLPWNRALKHIGDGKADAGFTARRTAERENIFYYASEILHLERTSIFTLKGSNIKAGKLDDLKGKSIGVVRGYSYGPEFDNHKEIKKIDCDTDEDLLRMLDRKRIELIVGSDEESIKYLSKKVGVEIEMIYIFDAIPSYIIFSKTLGERGKTLADKFSEALRQLKQEGFIEKVQSKYF
ncbi:MAG: hypothetical protein BWK80_01220 [Desulfobacteraceae bacterium IS3]|nr:MAG: hypothetical protein BWK80_01220 [Desulfobacteraceae bacterium IS3]